MKLLYSANLIEIFVAAIAALGIVLTSQAQQIMPAEKVEALRQSFPKSELQHWNKVFNDPKTVLYTDQEIIPAYQHADRGLIVVGGGGSVFGSNTRTSFQWPGYNISGDDLERQKPHGFGGNANIEFPWRTPGGLDHAENSIGKFRFFRLPDRKGGGVYPVAYFENVLHGSKMGPHLGLSWIFPVGTVFGEVLALRDSSGELNTFEVRLRIRQEGYWDVDILRPFPTSKDLEAELRKRGKDSLADTVAASPVEMKTLRDPLHRNVAFVSKAGEAILPSIDPALAKALLNETPFKSAVGADWKGGANTASSKQAFSIVPKDYLGSFLGNDPDSCMECHKHTQKHVDEFDSVRQWYGRVRGSDGIFTWHPIDARSVSRSGFQMQPLIRRDFISAGWVAQFDPAVHKHDRYHLLEGEK